jgi:hypothetical protein
LLVHIDQQRARAAQSKRASDMHADCGLAAAALLVENGDDFCCHYGLTFSAESANDGIQLRRNFSQIDIALQPVFQN